MTQTEARTRVRNLINQTDASNTLFSNADFIDHALNEGRRLFATILDEKHLIRLRKRAALSVAGGVGTYPADFLRIVKDPYVTIAPSGGSATPAKRIDENERWRLRFLTKQENVTPGTASLYFYEDSGGINLLPSTATACSYEYIKIPADLDGTENYELPDSVNDMTVEYAFEKTQGTTRGNIELAKLLAAKRGINVREVQSVFA